MNNARLSKLRAFQAGVFKMVQPDGSIPEWLRPTFDLNRLEILDILKSRR